MMHFISRRLETARSFLRPLRLSLAGLAVAFGATSAQAQPANAPLTLNIVDVGGAFNLLQTAIESYSVQHPNVKFNFKKATAIDLPKTLAAVTPANPGDIDMVLGGTDILATGIDQGFWINVLPDHANRFPGLMDRYLPEARRMQALANNQALAVVFALGGPLLEYNPAKVGVVPQTPQELLAWCKANPGRFTYARPANSGPGRTFLMGLPYLLGDKDPKDPAYGWQKTWAFLKDLNSCIDVYPVTTGGLMKELGAGGRDMTVSTTGWDINQRALGTVPRHFRIGAFNNMTWINDTQYMMVPKGVTGQRLNVVLDLMVHLLKREQQALTYDTGYFYPGPAIKNVPFSLAPDASQKVLRDFGRVEYVLWGLNRPQTQPLTAERMNVAFKMWDDAVAKPK